MSGIDFAKFPRVKELMDNTSTLQGKEDQIVWLQFNRSTAAEMIAEMHLMCKAGLSDSIDLRKRSKNAANYYYDAVGSNLHIFAKEQAWSELGLNNITADQLFIHKSFFAKIYKQQQLHLEG
jgi:hypothetical protein